MRAFAAAGLLVVFTSVSLAATCESLSSQHLPGVTITVAQSVAAGLFTPPYGPSVGKLPAFCRVAGVISPSSDSVIRFEVWMPAAGWNQRYLGAGNGGFAGSIGYGQLAGSVRRGFAAAGSDAGHEADGVDASWAYHHPEKVIDFGYRAVHETASVAKALIHAYYDHAPEHSYFDSCSDGGREALMEAQRFPEDYDGILAGAPANNWTHLVSTGIDLAKPLYTNPAGYISSVKLPAITAAVMAACDAQDGVRDGILSDPQSCHFDPSVLLCKGAETRTCLTAPQLISLKKLYSGSGVFPGFTPGW